MLNGEVQPNQNTDDLPVRKSCIRKGLHREINTEKFQQLIIIDEIYEEFEWKTLAEREKKLRNWEAILLKNFKVFHDQALEELGLEHKKAFFKDKQGTVGAPSLNSVNDLDSLDSLE
jgi:hypothetical protein